MTPATAKTSPEHDHCSASPAESSVSELQTRLVAAMEEVMEIITAGKALDRVALLTKHHEVSDELAECLDNVDFIQNVAPQLANEGAAREPTGVSVLSQNRTLGDFRILRELGRGGMGVVYEAEQLSIGRRVALKVLPFAAMLDKQQLNRFKNEARAAGTLDHPHIVAIHSVGVDRGVHYYAMQLVEGESLAQFIARQRLERGLRDAERGVKSAHTDATISHHSAPRAPEDTVDTAPVAGLSTIPTHNLREFYRTVARLGSQAAHALDHAHQNGILHRDVKPANLLVDNGGKLWVTDFGLARLEADAGMTMTGDLIGTLRYMSPEQALAKRVVVDHRSDIYSLGVTLYELVTLRPAYPATDRQELLRQIAFDEPLNPRQHDSRIPRDLETIILKSVEKNPSQRYATARELADDLERLLTHQPIKAKPPNWADRVVKWSRRHPVAIRTSALAFLATVLVLAGSVGWISRDRTARQAMLAQQVNLALEETRKSYDAGRPGEALSAVKRASGIVASSGGSVEFDEPIAQWQRDLNAVGRLEQIRSDSGSIELVESAFADRAYRDVFRGYDVDLESLDMEKAARSIRGSPIRRDLIAALHHWFWTNESDGAAPSLSSPRNKLLLQIANLADPDPWRTRLRDAILRSDVPALKAFVHDEALLDQTPSTILFLFYALASTLDFARSDGISLLEKAQRRYPDDFWINIELSSQLQGTQLEQSISYSRIAVALRPDSLLAYQRLAYNLLQHGDLEEAESAFREGIGLAPDDPFYYYQLANVLRDLDKNAEAEAILQEAPPLRHDYPDSGWNAVLGALLAAGKLDHAENLAREHIRLAPSHAPAHLALAFMLNMQRKFPQAEAAFREAIRLKPDDASILLPFIDFLHVQKKYADEEAMSRAVIRLAPSYPGAYGSLGAALEWQGKYAEAESAFGEGWGLANVMMKRADASGESPPWDAAAKHFASAVDKAEDMNIFGSGRKQVAYEMAKWNEVFERVLKLRPAESCLWIGRAERHVMHSRWDEAAADYARVIHARPVHHEQSEYAYLLVWRGDLTAYQRFCKGVVARAGEPKDAATANILALVCTAAPCDAATPAQIIEWAKQAAGRGNIRGTSVHNLGIAYLRAGQYENALKSFEDSTGYAWAWDEQLARNWFGRAIAHARLGHTDEGQHCLEAGRELMEQAHPPDEPFEHLSPVEWLSMHVLRREAETLLAPSTDVN